MKINEQGKEALIGFHAITGNDYISSFFGKGKRKCWKKLYQKYLNGNCQMFSRVMGHFRSVIHFLIHLRYL